MEYEAIVTDLDSGADHHVSRMDQAQPRADVSAARSRSGP
jgi:hypothetical protein